MQPRTFVELGVHVGDSYCAFCESVATLGLDTRCFGIDTWEGDPHAGLYGEEVYTDLQTHHDKLYGAFSTLMRSSFDEAAVDFQENSIDLLHIDGCHTYEAVRNDFETWAPKFTQRGVAILHDTQVHRPGYGVWRYWNEIKKLYPHFEFQHWNGLGVLCVGSETSPKLNSVTRMNGRQAEDIRSFFDGLSRILMLDHKNMQMEAQITAMERSLSWRVTAPLRRLAEQGPLNRVVRAIKG